MGDLGTFSPTTIYRVSHGFSILTIECEINKVSHVFNMSLDEIILSRFIVRSLLRMIQPQGRVRSTLFDEYDFVFLISILSLDYLIILSSNRGQSV
jgi:hypothetical protein